jgi:hypothetical protein
MIWVTLAILLGLLALSFPVAAVLGIVGLTLDQLYAFLPLYLSLGEMTWGASTDVILVAIPMFVLLGEILLRAGIAERMYAAMSHWLSWLPGGLMHSNIGACTLFSAVSGSSVATAATIGTVALPEIERENYEPRLFLGTVAAGGTLGILIPPSINMIVYGVLTDTSIPQLYLAGMLPGLVLALLFMATVLIACWVRPAWGGDTRHSSWDARIRSLPDLVPPLLIFALVIGSIYAGLATPTEAASLGVIAALILAAARRKLTIPMLKRTFEGTIRTSAMIMAILIDADSPPRGRVLSGPRDVHGDADHDGRDGADHHAGDRRSRLRPGVVRGSDHASDRDRHDHPAGRDQPVRGPGRARQRSDPRRDDRLGPVRDHPRGDDRTPDPNSRHRPPAARGGRALKQRPMRWNHPQAERGLPSRPTTT